jgi:hypothetical protein
MILESLEDIDPATFARDTGWDPKPHGLCRAEVCVPAPGSVRVDGTLDLEVAARRLGMPIVHDVEHHVYAVGPATNSGHALITADAADPELVTRHGKPFRLSSLHGRKVLLVAWASY